MNVLFRISVVGSFHIFFCTKFSVLSIITKPKKTWLLIVLFVFFPLSSNLVTPLEQEVWIRWVIGLGLLTVGDADKLTD